MSYVFNRRGFVIVTAYLREGPEQRLARLVLDTGAEFTVISSRVAQSLALAAGSSTQMISASNLVTIRLTSVDTISALGKQKHDFSVRVHDFPEGFLIDGLLGLDFLRDTRLTLDFRQNVLTLA